MRIFAWHDIDDLGDVVNIVNFASAFFYIFASS